MDNLQKEELVQLRDALSALMGVVQNGSCLEIPYFYRFLDFMKNNIESCLYTPADRIEKEEMMELLDEVLYRDWSAANDAQLGIASFDMLAEKTTDRPEICVKYLELVTEIDRYFGKEKSGSKFTWKWVYNE